MGWWKTLLALRFAFGPLLIIPSLQVLLYITARLLFTTYFEQRQKGLPPPAQGTPIT